MALSARIIVHLESQHANDVWNALMVHDPDIMQQVCQVWASKCVMADFQLTNIGLVNTNMEIMLRRAMDDPQNLQATIICGHWTLGDVVDLKNALVSALNDVMGITKALADIDEAEETLIKAENDYMTTYPDAKYWVFTREFQELKRAKFRAEEAGACSLRAHIIIE